MRLVTDRAVPDGVVFVWPVGSRRAAVGPDVLGLVRVGSEIRRGVLLSWSAGTGVTGQAGAAQGAQPVPAGQEGVFPGPGAADLQHPGAGAGGPAGRAGSTQPVAQRARLGALRSSQSYRPSSRTRRPGWWRCWWRHPAAVHQPGLRWQVVQAHRLRRPHLVLDDGVLGVQHVGELGARRLPGTPWMPVAAMLVTMMEYRQPVARSKAVRFLAWCREGFVRRTIYRRPSGQPADRSSRWVISATCLSCPAPPRPGPPRPARRQRAAARWPAHRTG